MYDLIKRFVGKIAPLGYIALDIVFNVLGRKLIPSKKKGKGPSMVYGYYLLEVDRRRTAKPISTYEYWLKSREGEFPMLKEWE